MAEEQILIELVRQAQQGRGNSMNKLAREAQENLRVYIYRITLDHDLAQDLSQDVLLQMVKSLKCLKNAESFRPWLYRIARNKIQQHYRNQRREASVVESAVSNGLLSHGSCPHWGDGLRRLIRKELSTMVMAAMGRIKDDHRAVLSLRCVEQLSYSDIGAAMDRSAGSVRIMYCRARQALKAGFPEYLP